MVTMVWRRSWPSMRRKTRTWSRTPTSAVRMKAMMNERIQEPVEALMA